MHNHIPHQALACNKLESATETLWQNFCRLRLQSSARRAVDDPVVAQAHADWAASYLEECETPRAGNAIALNGSRAI
jgi:hypothetical protein